MSWIGRVLFLLMLGGLNGCSLWFQRAPMTETSFTQGEANASVDEAVLYIRNLMTLSKASQRDAECKNLLDLYQQRGDQSVRIKLALSLLVSENCVPDASGKALSLLDDVMTNMKYSNLKDFLAYHRELALRLHQRDQQRHDLMIKISKWKKLNRQNLKKLQVCQDDLQETQMKLEALKKIERSLNHSEVQ